jgi:hypothetical protein
MSLVQQSLRTTRPGGVTGRGFLPGQSGNPGGRPKGLGRRVRELVGGDGHAIAEYMFTVLSDTTERTADRMEAAKWLADRGFGKAALVVDVGVTEDLLRGFLNGLSTEDLDAMVAILQKYSPDVAELAASGEIPIYPGSGGAPDSRRR